MVLEEADGGHTDEPRAGRLVRAYLGIRQAGVEGRYCVSRSSYIILRNKGRTHEISKDDHVSPH
jgi:hypothetical protein